MNALPGTLLIPLHLRLESSSKQSIRCRLPQYRRVGLNEGKGRRVVSKRDLRETSSRRSESGNSVIIGGVGVGSARCLCGEITRKSALFFRLTLRESAHIRICTSRIEHLNLCLRTFTLLAFALVGLLWLFEGRWCGFQDVLMKAGDGVQEQVSCARAVDLANSSFTHTRTISLRHIVTRNFLCLFLFLLSSQPIAFFTSIPQLLLVEI